jgi:hypothetical protein
MDITKFKAMSNVQIRGINNSKEMKKMQHICPAWKFHSLYLAL